jgi:hypothetical protein
MVRHSAAVMPDVSGLRTSRRHPSRRPAPGADQQPRGPPALAGAPGAQKHRRPSLQALRRERTARDESDESSSGRPRTGQLRHGAGRQADNGRRRATSSTIGLSGGAAVGPSHDEGLDNTARVDNRVNKPRTGRTRTRAPSFRVCELLLQPTAQRHELAHRPAVAEPVAGDRLRLLEDDVGDLVAEPAVVVVCTAAVSALRPAVCVGDEAHLRPTARRAPQPWS